MVGSFVFSLDQKIIGNELTLNYLTGVGVSFFKGSGYFADDGSEANMRITLWILPNDFAFSYNFFDWFYAREFFLEEDSVLLGQYKVVVTWKRIIVRK